jgi:hypothetical protein
MINSFLPEIIGKIKYSIIFLIIIGFISCEKEKVTSDPCQDNLKIRQVKADSLTMEEITYTGNCLVYEYIEAFSYKKYSYNSQNQLTKSEQAISFNPLSCFMQPFSSGETYTDPRKAKITRYYDFEYDDNGKPAKKLSYFLNGEQFQLVSYQTFDYENSLIKQLNRYNAQDELTEKNVYTYNENGNVIRDEYYTIEDGTNSVLMNTNEYEFDDKANPYRIFANECIPGKLTNANNILKSTYVDNYSGDEYTFTNEYSYEYNNYGLPVKMNNLSFIYGE